jgi:hypothetical protein
MPIAVDNQNVTIEVFDDHQKHLWQPLQFMDQDAEGWWALPEGRERLPTVYSILAKKR